MNAYKCRLWKLEYSYGKAAGVRAVIERLEDHAVLGPVRPGQRTVTSEVRIVDFGHGFLLTQNSMYVFEDRIELPWGF